MPEVIALRGRSALSSFRIAKLLASFTAVAPGHVVTGIAARYWHFIEVARPLDPREHETLVRLLTYGPVDEAGVVADASLVVVPRLGTISPWSSKATDIARNCALEAVRRIERGVAYELSTRERRPLADVDRHALLPLVHDRMTQTVLDDVAGARAWCVRSALP